MILDTCNITMLAPTDAAYIDMPDQSLDIHLSNNVLEHIPPETLRRVLATAARLLKPGGLCVHGIDHSDHFSHSDPTISRINFLSWDDREWRRYAGNRFMYMNQLRSSQYLPIFEAVGFEILNIERRIEDELVDSIKMDTLPLAKRFRGMPISDLATTSSLIVARRR